MHPTNQFLGMLRAGPPYKDTHLRDHPRGSSLPTSPDPTPQPRVSSEPLPPEQPLVVAHLSQISTLNRTKGYKNNEQERYMKNKSWDDAVVWWSLLFDFAVPNEIVERNRWPCVCLVRDGKGGRHGWNEEACQHRDLQQAHGPRCELPSGELGHTRFSLNSFASFLCVCSMNDPYDFVFAIEYSTHPSMVL